jgi:hypothetical protein
VHALLNDGVFSDEGEFLQLPYFDARLVDEAFRRRVFERRHRAERLLEEFQRSLWGWVHSGFSVHGEQRAEGEITARGGRATVPRGPRYRLIGSGGIVATVPWSLSRG